MVLYDRQLVALSRMAADIRARTGRSVNRAEIIRALIDALLESRLDVTRATSEADLRTLVRGRLRR